MAFQVSPGVQVKEVDLTNVVPAVSSTTGAFAGTFQWGPVDEVITVSDAKGLVDVFFQPADSNAGAEDFFSAESFLKYGSSLRVVRINSTGLFSANSGGDVDLLIKGEDDYVDNLRSGGSSGTAGRWVARHAGALGNSLKVSLCSTPNAYSQSAMAVVEGTNPEGGVSVNIEEGDGADFVVGDIVTFSNHTTEYKVTAIDTATTTDHDTLTIEALNSPSKTLQAAVPDAVTVSRQWEFAGLFDKAPGTSASAVKAGAVNDEVHVVVIDEDGSISGTPGEVLETHGFCSLGSDAKNSVGQSNYYRDVIARESKWVWWSGHSTDIMTTSSEHRTLLSAVSTVFSQPNLPVADSLANGADGRSPTAGQKWGAYDTHFGDGETSDVSFLIAGSTRTDNGSGTDQDILADHNTIVNQLILIAERRKDCMVIASPRRASVVGVAVESTAVVNVLADYSSVSSSSYAVLESGWIYQYDRYNDKYCWIPGNGHTAGIMARSDLLQDPWYSPAGFSRGQYLGITKLALNPGKGSRDDLYRGRVNPICTFPGQGTVLFGDKTGLSTPSAFDRINVRRLFIVLEKAIATAAKAQLFEFNDAFTRAQFRAAVEPFLRDVKNRRGLVDFSVICDETNNTDSVIDRNEFVCSIFVKPARSINFITLNFVAARSGVEFEEIYGAV
jgi:hypothetical protein